MKHRCGYNHLRFEIGENVGLGRFDLSECACFQRTQISANMSGHSLKPVLNPLTDHDTHDESEKRYRNGNEIEFHGTGSLW